MIEANFNVGICTPMTHVVNSDVKKTFFAVVVFNAVFFILFIFLCLFRIFLPKYETDVCFIKGLGYLHQIMQQVI